MEGQVVVKVRVDRRGEVTRVRLVRGHPLMVQACLDAARQWRFRPMLRRGKPVAFTGLLRFEFSTSGRRMAVDGCLVAGWG